MNNEEMVTLTDDEGQAIAITKGHEAALLDLFEASHMRQLMGAGVEIGLTNILVMKPGLTPYAHVVRTWLDETIGHDAIHRTVLAMYARVLTEAEARDLAAFYRTPLGEKLLDGVAPLSVRLATMGRRLVAAREDVLARRIGRAVTESLKRVPS